MADRSGVEASADSTSDGQQEEQFERAVHEARVRDIALVAASPWFEPKWYLLSYPDVGAGGVEPAEHYVDYGWREARDPGPLFSTAWYLEAHPDVAASELNPLVHYLMYGKAERRSPNGTGLSPERRAEAREGGRDNEDLSRATEQERKDAAIVRKSPLFDDVWYIAQRVDLDCLGDPALHYVLRGTAEDLDPGPRFSTTWYLEKHPDVATMGLNPLVHFLRYGRGEGRIGMPERISGSAVLDPDKAAAVAKTGADRQKGKSRKHLQRQQEVLLGGQTIGLLHDSAQALDDSAAQVLLAFSHAHGWPIQKAVVVGGEAVAARLDTNTWPPPDGLAALNVKLSDAWIINSATIRLRFEPTQEEQFEARWRLRFYQAYNGDLVHCGESIVDGIGPAFIDAGLVNEYKPLLAILTNENNQIDAIALIPFPSLLRGGAHHAELVSGGERTNRMADLAQISNGMLREWFGWNGSGADLSIAEIHVNCEGATGAERIYQPAAREWLTTMFGITIDLIEPSPQLALAHVAGRTSGEGFEPGYRTGKGVLRIPADALPTLALITSRRLENFGAATPGSFLISDVVSSRPKLHVAVPPMIDLFALQPSTAPKLPALLARERDGSSQRTDASGFPLAIRFRQQVHQSPNASFPIAPDSSLFPVLTDDVSASVTVIVGPAGSKQDVLPLLTTIAGQSGVSELKVIVLVDKEADASPELRRLGESLLLGRLTFLPVDRRPLAAAFNLATQYADGDMLLFADPAVLLHDVRTVQTLITLTGSDHTFSASCGRLHSAAQQQDQVLALGAFTPSRLSLTHPPFLRFEEPVSSVEPIVATLPVAANSGRFLLVRAGAFRELGGFDERSFPTAGFDLELGLRALVNGWRNLNTGAVVVTDNSPSQSAWSIDPVAPNYLHEVGWQDVAGSIALIRELQ